MNGIQLTVVGNLTRDPEVSVVGNGSSICKFGVAVERSWKSEASGEWERATSFIDVICWRYVAEDAARLLKKGMRVMLSGRLDQQSWEDRETGQKRSKFEFTADEIGLMLKNVESFERKQYEPRENGSARPVSAGARSAAPKAAVNDDDIWG